jgi:hypothetical protein
MCVASLISLAMNPPVIKRRVRFGNVHEVNIENKQSTHSRYHFHELTYVNVVDHDHNEGQRRIDEDYAMVLHDSFV